MKLDKLIKDSKLVERLDKLDPDNASGSKNDGIKFWKGKKIVTLDEWKKIANIEEGFQESREHQVTKKEALQYFPDDYERSLFPLVVPQELMDAVKKWHDHYLELMQFRNNSKCGRSLCFQCLLCPDKKKSGEYEGISRLVARAIEFNNQEKEEEEEEDHSNSDTSTTTHSLLYPCSVLNRFNCPYDRKEEMKRKNPKSQQQEEDDEESNLYDVDYLFLLSAYSFRAESAFIRARKEKSTVLVPINSVEDIYNALTNRETLDKLLQQDLDEEQLEYKDEIVEFFMSIKDTIRMEDLIFYNPSDT